ncbi:MAG: CDP-glycerol glycerophosphotransferase family protein [Xanthomonadales bacterium]|nr:CDP-glycerol glycerophosphotransferase family protein [Xanthomonadales bacterium]
MFEYGHPRLEELHREATATAVQRSDETTVLVAPTWGADSIFNRVGAALLQTLLEAGMRVIMRPHYQTRRQSPEVIDALLEQFSAHQRFEYVDRMGENASLFRSDLLVSDWSAMAIEYALALEKPVLFIDLPRRVRNPDWQALGIEPIEAAIRPQVGRVLAPDRLDDAPRAVAELLRDREEFSARMRALRERAVFNFGASVPVGAAEIARLADEVAGG